jgi:hypothetical protein
MPSLLFIEGFRFFFYSNENKEPAHVHIEKGDATAKFWLEPIRIANSFDFSEKELKRIHTLVLENRDVFLEKWNEYFNRNQ